MSRILATALTLLLAAPCAHAATEPVAPRSGDDVPSATTPASPEAQSLSRSAIDDDTITHRVTTAMHADPRLAGADVSVNTDHGVVSLTGSVRSGEQVAAAIESAQSPDGVMRVDNHLSVTPP
jgi:hyperosmotically inducible protein